MSALRTLRRRIADSPRLNAWIAAKTARHIERCHLRTDWQTEGLEELRAAAQVAPVIYVTWHQRLLLAPLLVRAAGVRPLSTLTSGARAGRMAGDIINHFGFDTLAMSSHKRHVALSREVLRRYRSGHSLGIAADGPRGPAEVCSTVPLVWARLTGARIFCGAAALRHRWHLPTWDRMILPRGRSQGAMVVREWPGEVPKGADDATLERLRQDLERTLAEVNQAADQRI